MQSRFPSTSTSLKPFLNLDKAGRKPCLIRKENEYVSDLYINPDEPTGVKTFEAIAFDAGVNMSVPELAEMTFNTIIRNINWNKVYREAHGNSRLGKSCKTPILRRRRSGCRTKNSLPSGMGSVNGIIW